MSNATVQTKLPTNTFVWLLKREFWEYRGAFVRTPLIIACVMLSLVFFGLVVAQSTAQRHGVTISGIHLDEITSKINPDAMEKFYAGFDLGLLSLAFPIGIGLFFVLFSYATGALYNDRADRSVLFWKSLPISDTQTVLAKVVAASFMAPALAVAGVIFLQIGFLVLMSLYMILNGLNPALLWSPTHLIALWIKLIVLIPFNALWALPSLGWLLLVSSFVRSKPFLWGFMLPFVAGVLVSVFKLTQELSLSSSWFWHYVVLRAVFSFVPGSWINFSELQELRHEGDVHEVISNLISFDAFGRLLASPNLWIGAVAGVAMIVAAIHFRRQRVESYA